MSSVSNVVQTAVVPVQVTVCVALQIESFQSRTLIDAKSTSEHDLLLGCTL